MRGKNARGCVLFIHIPISVVLLCLSKLHSRQRQAGRQAPEAPWAIGRIPQHVEFSIFGWVIPGTSLAEGWA